MTDAAIEFVGGPLDGYIVDEWSPNNAANMIRFEPVGISVEMRWRNVDFPILRYVRTERQTENGVVYQFIGAA